MRRRAGGPAYDVLAAYLGGLPVMNRTQAGGVLAGLANIHNDTDTLLYALRDLGQAPDVTSREGEKADQIDLRQEQVIERHHHLENEMLDAVASGDEKRALRVRIDLAREMLRRDEPRSVSSIARSVGFADPSYFSRRFKAIVGCSPSEYRKRERAG